MSRDECEVVLEATKSATAASHNISSRLIACKNATSAASTLIKRNANASFRRGAHWVICAGMCSPRYWIENMARLARADSIILIMICTSKLTYANNFCVFSSSRR